MGKTAAQKPQHNFRVHGVLLDSGSVLNCISDCVATQLRSEHKAAWKIIINVDRTERIMTEAEWFPFWIGSIKSEILAYVMPDPVPYNMLLGRAWMHLVKSKGNYGNNTNTILDSDGK